jgi:hypothetical protein
MTSGNDPSAPLAVTFSAVAAVRALPAIERDDPVAALDAVRAAIAGELWEALSVPAIAHLLTVSAEWAWTAGVTRLPPAIDCPEAAEMLHLTGAPRVATAAGCRPARLQPGPARRRPRLRRRRGAADPRGHREPDHRNGGATAMTDARQLLILVDGKPWGPLPDGGKEMNEALKAAYDAGTVTFAEPADGGWIPVEVAIDLAAPADLEAA